MSALIAVRAISALIPDFVNVSPKNHIREQRGADAVS